MPVVHEQVGRRALPSSIQHDRPRMDRPIALPAGTVLHLRADAFSDADLSDWLRGATGPGTTGLGRSTAGCIPHKLLYSAMRLMSRQGNKVPDESALIFIPAADPRRLAIVWHEAKCIALRSIDLPAGEIRQVPPKGVALDWLSQPANGPRTNYTL